MTETEINFLLLQQYMKFLLPQGTGKMIYNIKLQLLAVQLTIRPNEILLVYEFPIAGSFSI